MTSQLIRVRVERSAPLPELVFWRRITWRTRRGRAQAYRMLYKFAQTRCQRMAGPVSLWTEVHYQEVGPECETDEPGWTVCDNGAGYHPITGRFMAYRAGVRIGAGTMADLRAMIEARPL